MQPFKLILLLSEIYLIKGNSCCFTDFTRNLNIDMHLDVYEAIVFKLDMIKGTTEPHVLILV